MSPRSLGVTPKIAGSPLQRHSPTRSVHVFRPEGNLVIGGDASANLAEAIVTKVVTRYEKQQRKRETGPISRL